MLFFNILYTLIVIKKITNGYLYFLIVKNTLMKQRTNSQLSIFVKQKTIQ